MLKPRFILAALTGAIAAAIVWHWPVGPTWRSEPDVGTLTGFSLDGSIIVRSHLKSVPGTLLTTPEVTRWDAATGKVLSRTEMICSDIREVQPPEFWPFPDSIRAVRPSPDGRIALVGEGVNDGANEIVSGNWYLHDAITGKRLSGPIEGVSVDSSQYFSPDGHWFVARSARINGLAVARGRLGIYAAESGKLIREFPDRDGLPAANCVFASDGATAAVHWTLCVEPGPDQLDEKRRHAVQIIELPSGRERRWVDLPPRPGMHFDYWDGQNLVATTAEKQVRSKPFTIQRSTRVFDLSRESAGDGVEDPLLHTDTGAGTISHWKLGPDWLMQYTIVFGSTPRTGFAGWLDRIAERLGIVPPPSRHPQASVRFLDRTTGAPRYELPRPINLDLYVSQDGRRIACGGHGKPIEVWDTYPPVRWHKALLAGLAAAGGVLAIAKWRRSRAVAKAAVSPSV